MTYSLVVSDVSVAKAEDAILHDLKTRYAGVKNVTRWYFDENGDDPMACVQVDFDSLENINKVLDNGSIVIDGICHRVSAMKGKGPRCHRCGKIGHKTYECDRPALDEQDLMNMFAEQKR